MQTDKSMQQLLDHHQQLYQKLGVQDIYKLLYQGCMGPAHLLSNPEKARDYLYVEWQRVPVNADEPMLVPVSLDGALVRINIAPAKYRNISPDTIWKMLFHTASNFKQNKNLFLDLWNYIQYMIDSGELELDRSAWIELDQQAAAKDYPAMHHTPEYREANCPAYRVIFVSEYVNIDIQ